MLYKGTPHFDEAVLRMAASPKSLQLRLADALQDVSVCELPGYLPDHLAADLRALMERCTTIDPERVDIAGDLKGEGTITATCATFTDAEAVAAAQAFVRIHKSLDELWAEYLRQGGMSSDRR